MANSNLWEVVGFAVVVAVAVCVYLTLRPTDRDSDLGLAPALDRPLRPAGFGEPPGGAAAALQSQPSAGRVAEPQLPDNAVWLGAALVLAGVAVGALLNRRPGAGSDRSELGDR
ncbi:hypothetical protein SAMN05892883_2506 [Jatrophihabitans sp. GAS493]|uniref:hypothetical protein n=1 Tax=Jatrophihabitans sp. GAS493 TaxID=1907575 RepID=UPI000BB7641E|nr:hypothetical protein [Jatrophihabitans sp. GAS493]SOD73215.1 hypothetical protein SAMN05892883_2506 [Jatrophihabitans sp. GAS493]